jgi:hypothetical protein
MRKTIPKSAFKVRAETPQIARGYSGMSPQESLPRSPEPTSEVERKERSALRDSKVLYGGNDLSLTAPQDCVLKFQISGRRDSNPRPPCAPHWCSSTTDRW